MVQLSVLMPVYNAEAYLQEALDSLYNQTFTDFEIIIIDDASTDKTSEILAQQTDSRLKVTTGKTNKGLAARLNEAFLKSSGRYIARMDGDDICHPQRLEKQIRFLDENSKIDICGTNFTTFPSGKEVKMPENHQKIIKRHLFTTGLCHPSVMMRRYVLENASYPNFSCAQDYGLWVVLEQQGYRFSNIQKSLLQYRIHTSSTTAKKSGQKAKFHNQIHKQILTPIIGKEPTKEELQIHHMLSARIEKPLDKI